MDLETFQSLPTGEVARLMREAGPKVCVFPINGTRRWFMLEHGLKLKPEEDFVSAYLDRLVKRHIELYKLLFDHGIDTLLTPVLGPDILEREKHEELIERGLTAWFGQNSDFLDFYGSYDVRVHVYGDARRYLQNTPYAHVLDAFDEIAQHTATHRRHRLFFGVCAHDPVETIAEIAVHFYQEHGCLPNKRQIVEAYYGEYVEPIGLFIGFSKLRAFDMPLVTTGTEDLYFTVSPSPYLTECQLRDILYDHLYTRRGEPDYSTMSANDWTRIKDFYRANLENTLGVGTKHRRVWYPLPQVKPLADFAKSF